MEKKETVFQHLTRVAKTMGFELKEIWIKKRDDSSYMALYKNGQNKWFIFYIIKDRSDQLSTNNDDDYICFVNGQKKLTYQQKKLNIDDQTDYYQKL